MIMLGVIKAEPSVNMTLERTGVRVRIALTRTEVASTPPPKKRMNPDPDNITELIDDLLFDRVRNDQMLSDLFHGSV